MKIDNKYYRTIWPDDNDNNIIKIIDQRQLPHQLIIESLGSLSDIVVAIKDMHVRGAPLIGATAAFGVYFAVKEAVLHESFDQEFDRLISKLRSSRPTAVDLFKAIDIQLANIQNSTSLEEKKKIAYDGALAYVESSVNQCKILGEFGTEIIDKISEQKQGKTLNILTHCNAGWLATVDYGTATSPIYQAYDKGIKLHVWVDETRPRNQGANLTAFELGKHGVPNSVIVDNTGGHLMQHGMVDLVIVGTDRTTSKGDVANKIGTYLKALAANDNNVPFYVAAPSSSIDFSLEDGIKEIPIEIRDENEVKYVRGLHNNELKEVLITPSDSKAANYGFDVTPARLITGIITERGICKANKQSILDLFPEHKKKF